LLDLTHDLFDQCVKLFPALLPIPGDPPIKLTPSNEDLAPDPIAGQGMEGIGEIASEGSDRQAAVASEGLEGEVGVKGDRHRDTFHDPDWFEPLSRSFHFGLFTPHPGARCHPSPFVAVSPTIWFFSRSLLLSHSITWGFPPPLDRKKTAEEKA